MIEKHLEESTQIMGAMVQDTFYMLDNRVLLNCLNSAVDAHHNWLNTLAEMAQTGTLKVLQTDCTKCGLGHFIMRSNQSIRRLQRSGTALKQNIKTFMLMEKK